jgi:hypothetical protein
LRDNSSPADPPATAWRRARIGWPIERVPLVIEVAHPRKLTALEWVVLRVVDAFGDDVPDLTEVAEELGIADPAFLRDTLRDVVRLRALEPRSQHGSWASLSDLRFTEMGRELFRKGKIEAEPAEHGLELFFDALTDEARKEPKGLQDLTESAFPPGQPPPAPRSAVGLDRVREIIRSSHPELLRGDGEVRSVQPSPGAWPRISWATVDVDLRVTADGQLVAVGSGLSPAAQQLLGDADLDDAVVPRTGITAEWGLPAAKVCRSRLTHAAWTSIVHRTLPDGTADAEVLRMLQGSPAEVLLHAGWAERPAVAARLEDLVRRGARVAILGVVDTKVTVLPDPSKPGVLAQIACSREVPAAAVIDGRVGLLADEVVLRLGSTPTSIELAGLLNVRGCEHARQLLLQALLSGLPAAATSRPAALPVLAPIDNVEAQGERVLSNEEVSRSLARLAFLQRPEDLELCTLHVSERAPGPERVWTLSRVGTLAIKWVPALGEGVSQAASLGAWLTLVEQLGRTDHPSAHVMLLAHIAPPGASAEPLVSSAVPRTAALASTNLGSATDALVALRDAVDNRWGQGTCAGIAPFLSTRAAILSHGGFQDLVARLTAARRLLTGEELRSWTRDAANRLPAPTSPFELEAWVDDATLLREFDPEAVDELASAHLRRLAVAQPSLRLTLVRATAKLLSGEAILTTLLGAKPDPRELASVARTLSSAGVRVEAGAIRSVVDQLLPAHTTLPSVAASDGQLDGLVALVLEVELAAPAVKTWASRCANSIPAPETLHALPWWLSELSHLRMLLDNLPEYASRVVAVFAPALQGAKERSDPSWDDVLQSWQELGLSEGALATTVLARERPPERPSTAGGGKKKHGRKR